MIEGVRIYTVIVALVSIAVHTSSATSTNRFVNLASKHEIDFSKSLGEIIQAISDSWHVPVVSVPVKRIYPLQEGNQLVDFVEACMLFSSKTGLLPKFQGGVLHFIRPLPVSSWSLWRNSQIDEPSVVIQLLSHLARNYKHWRGNEPLNIPVTDSHGRRLIAILLRQYALQFEERIYSESVVILSVSFVPKLLLLDKRAAMLFDAPLVATTARTEREKRSNTKLTISCNAQTSDDKNIRIPRGKGHIWTLKSIAKFCRDANIRVYVDRRIANNHVVLTSGVWGVRQLLSAIAFVQELELRQIEDVWFISAHRMPHKALRSAIPYIRLYTPEVLNTIAWWRQHCKPSFSLDIPFNVDDFISLAQRKFRDLSEQQKQYILNLLVAPKSEGINTLRAKLLLDLLLFDTTVRFIPQLIVGIRLIPPTTQDGKQETYFVVFP